MTQDARTPSTQAVELRSGALRLALRPDLGGSIAGLWIDGRAGAAQREAGRPGGARQSGCYPLLPYSNRLGYRRFRWQGKEYTTAANFDDSPHSVHGIGWQRAWTSGRPRDACGADTHAPGDAALALHLRGRQAISS
jgi:aldose 1-epimerase